MSRLRQNLEGRITAVTKLIAWLTSILFSLVAVGSFALSYNALRAIAIANGIPDNWLGDIWPLLVDFSLIVFSLAVVTAHLYSESTRKQWVLVTIYTIATVMFNMLHAPDNLLARVIATIPPISLFFSFELLMEQLRNSVMRKTSIIPTKSIEDTNQDSIEIPTPININDVPTNYKMELLADMLGDNPKPTNKELAQSLGVSVATIGNWKRELAKNGHH